MKLNNIFVFVAALVFFATGCGQLDVGLDLEGGADAEVNSVGFTQTGMASYYGVGDGFHGRRTANGETFNAYGLTAAHRTLRFGSCLLVTNLYNGRKAKVRVNDRGPYSGGRILDLSYGAAQAVGMVSSGTARVSIEGISCSAPATTSNSGGDASAANLAPATDNVQCKIFLSTAPAANSEISVTIQSRVGDTTRPCGKKLKLLGSGSAAQAKEIAAVDMTSGDGRKTLKVKASELEGLSHIFAQALDSKGERMGESAAKQLQLTAAGS
ncbi:MAG: septal ring lytic transglycosylase RlpA family protein [Betaproteobacteria bacterium]|nr:septal ring lytic transglycosylase RlpA family protein [Betaproteobacteria bacterium]